MLFSFIEVVGITVVYSLYTSPLVQERSASLACQVCPLRGKTLGFFRGRVILKRLRLAALAHSQRRFRVLTTALRHQLMAETRTTGQTHSQLTTPQVAGAFQFCDPLPRYSDLSRPVSANHRTFETCSCGAKAECQTSCRRFLFVAE